jgi:hypothetical protein
MPRLMEADDDRRSSERFMCSCDAKVICLPSEGSAVPAKVLDLSLGGCCVDSTLKVARGGRVEIQVSVKGASFRVVGDVKAIRSESECCVEFRHLSAIAKEALGDLIVEMARWRAIMDELIEAGYDRSHIRFTGEWTKKRFQREF